MLTPQQIQQLKSSSANGGISPTQVMTPEQAKASFNVISSTPVQSTRQTTPKPNMGARVAQDFANAGKGIQEGANQYNIGQQEMAKAKNFGQSLKGLAHSSEGLFHGAVAAVTGAFSPLTELAAPVVGKVFDVLKQQNPDLINAYNAIAPHIQKLAEEHPMTAQGVGDAIKLGLAFLGGDTGPAASNKVLQVGSDIVDVTKGAIKDIGTKSSDATIPGAVSTVESDASILNNFNRGVKPSVAGKGTASQVADYGTKVVDAVKTITQNKDVLNITDEFGDATGTLPKNPRELGQAIEQTKQQIFNQYDALAKAAGDKGFSLQLKPVASELEKLATDPVVNDLHPELAAYAKERAATLTERSIYSPSQAQTAIQNLNKSLESFYKNPSYETASKASVDAMIANNLRKGLDDVIEGSSPEAAAVRKQMGEASYKELKQKYGALKAIEKDVNKRAQILARKTGGGLSFGDVFSAEEVIRGLATMNPAAIATGVGVKTATTLWKYFNNPDRYITNMFREAEGQLTSMGKIPSSTINAPKQ